jgi:excisionase family DNA binding protein
MRERRLWPILLSISECSACLNVERREIYAAIASRALPLYRHGTKRRVLTADVVDWIRRTCRGKGDDHETDQEAHRNRTAL